MKNIHQYFGLLVKNVISNFTSDAALERNITTAVMEAYRQGCKDTLAAGHRYVNDVNETISPTRCEHGFIKAMKMCGVCDIKSITIDVGD